MFVKRELLKRKIKRAPFWQDVEEYNNMPFKHQIRDVIKKYHDVTLFADDVTVPESWTFSSIILIDGVLYLGQKRYGREVVFKRELPFCLKSAVSSKFRTTVLLQPLASTLIFSCNDFLLLAGVAT